MSNPPTRAAIERPQSHWLKHFRAVQPARYLTKTTALMGLHDLLLCTRFYEQEYFSTPLEMLRAFEFLAPAEPPRTLGAPTWWRITNIHQTVGGGLLGCDLHNIEERRFSEDTLWFLDERWGMTILSARKQNGIRAEELLVPGKGFRKPAMKARVFRADGSEFEVSCS